MKVWFTRPSTWDLLVAGIDRCTMWLREPFFDRSPRGKERDPLYPHLPTGWRVLDPVHGDMSSQVSIPVREVFRSRRNEDIAQALWDALCRSVDGKGATDGGPAPRRWQDLAIDDEQEREAMVTFVFEYNAPPQLWFDSAWHNGWEDQTAAGRWAQQIFELDTLMGIEADDPPPIATPVIGYVEGRATLSRGGAEQPAPLCGSRDFVDAGVTPIALVSGRATLDSSPIPTGYRKLP